MYLAKSEDIVMAAGGTMGSPVVENWTRFYKKASSAVAACEKDYGKPIKWRTGRKKAMLDSGDLGHVQYTIRLIKTED